MKSLHEERNRQEENERAIERHSNEGTFKSGSLTCARQARLTDKGERWWEGCWASCEFWAGDKPTWLGTNTTEKKCTGGNSKKKVVIRLTWRLEQRLVGTVRSGDQVRFGLMLNWRAHKSHSPSPLQLHASRMLNLLHVRRQAIGACVPKGINYRVPVTCWPGTWSIRARSVRCAGNYISIYLFYNSASEWRN